MARLGRFPRQRVKLLLFERLHPGVRGSARNRRRQGNDDEGTGWRETSFKVLEGGATALGSVVILGLAGYGYHTYYKSLVLRKMENAFAVGYSSLEEAALSRHMRRNANQDGISSPFLPDELNNEQWIPRDEQSVVDGIVDGSIKGQYHLLTGEKGTGKTSMLLTAMKKIHGEGVAMLEAHGDLEIFRIRLGKALDFEFHEDYIGSLFSFKGPRDTTALLDIERAFNKMEKIALKRKHESGKPLVLIINGVHLLRDNDDGRNLLELIQQRAELWAASSLVTVVLNSDDYWITERLMWQATRLRIIPVHDIRKGPALTALKDYRAHNFQEEVPISILNEVYDKIGGRLRFLNHVANSPDMIKAATAICEKEKRWFLNQCWILGKEMDDNAEDHQDYSTAAMVVAKVLVEKEQTMKRDGTYDGGLPQISLHEARQLMTRPDFIQKLDQISIFTIDSNSMVQADSVAMQNAFKEIVLREGFEEHLQATLERLDELEHLGRTKVLSIKDLWNDGEYQAVIRNGQSGSNDTVLSIKAVQPAKRNE